MSPRGGSPRRLRRGMGTISQFSAFGDSGETIGVGSKEFVRKSVTPREVQASQPKAPWLTNEETLNSVVFCVVTPSQLESLPFSQLLLNRGLNPVRGRSRSMIIGQSKCKHAVNARLNRSKRRRRRRTIGRRR